MFIQYYLEFKIRKNFMTDGLRRAYDENAAGGQGACCEPHSGGPGAKLLLFWCPNMLKQPVYGMFLGLINPQILFFFEDRA